MNEPYRIFGQNLHYLIQAYGCGFRQFAKELGIDYSLLKRYMSGRVAPRKKRLEEISSRLGVKPGSLMFDDLVPEILEAENEISSSN